jgi:hypothetical protein
MKTSSISLLPLLLVLLLPLCTPWCYKGYMPLTNEVAKIDISPDNAYMAIVSINAPNRVFVYDLANYNLLLNYSVTGHTITSAKFTNDGIFLGVGTRVVGGGSVNLLSGRPPFSSTVIRTFVGAGNIADIDFNRLNNKLLVCYSNINRYDIYTSYSGTVLTDKNITVPNSIRRCKFTANDDIAFIDDNEYFKIYRASSNTVSTNVQGANNDFKQLDIKNSTTGATKFLVVGNDTKIFYNNDPTTNLNFVSTSTTSGLSNG